MSTGPQAGPNPIRLAVIESDSGLLQVLTRRLDAAGWRHRVLGGAVPVEELVSLRLNALVVDPALLGADGEEWLERVCTSLPGLGVIVSSGPSTVVRRVRGLRLGADDWVTKPYHPEELIARVEAVVRRRRRAAPRAEPGPLVAGEVEVRPDQFQAFVGGGSLELTRREFELLALLAESAGQVLEREEIYHRVWGYAMAHGDRSVDVFVRKLRHKLERRSPGWRYIHTHFGIGYRFAPEPAEEGAQVAPAGPAPAAEEPPAGDGARAGDPVAAR